MRNQSLNRIDQGYHRWEPSQGKLDQPVFRLEQQPTGRPFDSYRAAIGFEPPRWALIGVSFLLSWRHLRIDARSPEYSHGQRRRRRIPLDRLCPRRSARWPHRIDLCVRRLLVAQIGSLHRVRNEPGPRAQVQDRLVGR